MTNKGLFFKNFQNCSLCFYFVLDHMMLSWSKLLIQSLPLQLCKQSGFLLKRLIEYFQQNTQNRLHITTFSIQWYMWYNTNYVVYVTFFYFFHRCSVILILYTNNNCCKTYNCSSLQSNAQAVISEFYKSLKPDKKKKALLTNWNRKYI